MSVVTMKQLLESGVHFGHQTHKWNPKMDRYIFIKRNGIHILDLKQTLDAVNETYMFIRETISKGESILFIGTKKQAKEAIEQAAKKCGAFYVSNRWYGGMLTNMMTIRRSIEKLDYFEQIVEDGTINSFTKLEATRMRHKYEKILAALDGIRNMERLPGVVFIVDIIKESIALNEARKLGIPVAAMVDTNADPDLVDYVIPSNDDAIRAIHLITDIMAEAVLEGRQALTEGTEQVAPKQVPSQEKPEEKPEEEMIAPPQEEKAKPKKAAPKTEKKPEAKKKPAPRKKITAKEETPSRESKAKAPQKEKKEESEAEA